LREYRIVISLETPWEIQKNTTVYKIDTIDVDGKPEVTLKLNSCASTATKPSTVFERTEDEISPAVIDPQSV
jgi:hypothetical protein